MNVSKLFTLFMLAAVSINGFAMPEKVVCDFSGVVAPEFPEAYMEIKTNSLEIVGVYDFGSNFINFVNDSLASRQPVDWNLCEANSSFSNGIFSSRYDCPLSGSLKSTRGQIELNLENGNGHYRFDLIAHNDAISTSLHRLKNCRIE